MSKENNTLILCEFEKGTEVWNKFVEKAGNDFDERNDKTESRTTITILNPPNVSVFKRIMEICRKRHKTLKGDYLLMEYGYNKLYKVITDFNLIYKYKMVKDIRFGFSTIEEVPIINAEFCEKADREVSHGSVVLNVTKKQLAKINRLCEILGFAKVYELGLACVIFSLGDMLGNSCKGSMYEVYCKKYPESLKNKLEEQDNILNGWLIDHLELMVRKVIEAISYCKLMDKEYEYGFNSKLFQTVWVIDEVGSILTNKDNDTKNLIKDLNMLRERYKELNEIIDFKMNELSTKIDNDITLNELSDIVLDEVVDVNLNEIPSNNKIDKSLVKKVDKDHSSAHIHERNKIFQEFVKEKK